MTETQEPLIELRRPTGNRMTNWIHMVSCWPPCLNFLALHAKATQTFTRGRSPSKTKTQAEPKSERPESRSASLPRLPGPFPLPRLARWFAADVSTAGRRRRPGHRVGRAAIEHPADGRARADTMNFTPDEDKLLLYAVGDLVARAGLGMRPPYRTGSTLCTSNSSVPSAEPKLVRHNHNGHHRQRKNLSIRPRPHRS